MTENTWHGMYGTHASFNFPDEDEGWYFDGKHGICSNEGDTGAEIPQGLLDMIKQKAEEGSKLHQDAIFEHIKLRLSQP